MKSIWTKIPAMIGMLLTLATVLWLIAALMYLLLPDLLDDGTSFYEPIYEAWMCEISALLYSVFSMIFYVVDAVISVIKANMKIDRDFNIMLTIIIVIGVALGAWAMSPMRIYKSVIWFSYCLLLFAAEIISVIKHIKHTKAKRAEKQKASV